MGVSIQRWRISLGMTATEAARAAGIHVGMWGRIESGETPNPLFSTVQKMFAAMWGMVEIKAAPQRTRPAQLPLPKPDNRVHADA